MELIIWITLKFNVTLNITRNAILVINFSRIFKKTFCTKYNKLQQSTNYFTAKYKYRRCSFKNLKFLYLEECQFSSMYFPFKLLSLVFFLSKPRTRHETQKRFLWIIKRTNEARPDGNQWNFYRWLATTCALPDYIK